MKETLKSAFFGVLIGLFYSIIANKIFNIPSYASLRKIIFFIIIGLISGIIYSIFTKLFRNQLDKSSTVKYIVYNMLGTLIGVYICGVCFYLLNVLFLASHSSSPEHFMLSVYHVTFEIMVYFALVNLIINFIRIFLITKKREFHGTTR